MKKHILFLALAIALAFSGCRKESPSYAFTVKVVTEDGIALPNVAVEASADVPDALPDFSGLTDEDGMVRFQYEYEAVLKIRATRGTNPPTWMGCNFVKLQPNDDVEVIVVLLPFDPTQPGC